MKLNYYPVNDGYGIIGYHWECNCGNTIQFASPGSECPRCYFVIPEDSLDPDDWYDEQMKKPVRERDWSN